MNTQEQILVSREHMLEYESEDVQSVRCTNKMVLKNTFPYAYTDSGSVNAINIHCRCVSISICVWFKKE